MINKLNELGKTTQITIKWVKAHNLSLGNNLADEEAKLGTGNSENRHYLPAPMTLSIGLIKDHSQEQWNKRWSDSIEYRQTKIWLPKFNRKFSKYCLHSTREELGLLVNMITGHNWLNYHESLVSQGEVSPLCRFCKSTTEESWHIIGNCDCFWQERQQAFGKMYLENPPEWKPVQLKKFFKLANIAELNIRDDIDENNDIEENDDIE